MSIVDLSIPLILNNDQEIKLHIYADSVNSLFEIDSHEAYENGESPYQIIEGCGYEYHLPSGYKFLTSEVVTSSKVNPSSGRIIPNNYVGMLSIDILETCTLIKRGTAVLEVRSIKTTYRTDYRKMLEDITEKCTDLLMQYSSPIAQNFEPDYAHDAQTNYQRFAFIKSIIASEEFQESIYRIVHNPVTSWAENDAELDTRRIRKLSRGHVRQIVQGNSRIPIPENHSLRERFSSITTTLRIKEKSETIDTPENRFVKYVLSSLKRFCQGLKPQRGKLSTRFIIELSLVENQLGRYLEHEMFKEISWPDTIPMNSPILHRREGYRELFKAWLMFDLAAKLIWKGGEDVYRGGKRDVAILYEYWLFFQLLDLLEGVFKVRSKGLKNLIVSTSEGMGLQLRQGQHLAIQGIFDSGTRRLNIEFSYNKTFVGGKKYPEGGSWTSSMRPDYTLSIWPFGVTLEEAEVQELVAHLHFDAKYKIENLAEIFESNSLGEENFFIKGGYKRLDILKMHTYRDAIRRTVGAYILYPGGRSARLQGFHEILPGLGAFAISPSRNISGLDALKLFLNDVVTHFLNRASQREKMLLQIYEIYRNKPSEALNSALPELLGPNRSLLPDETFVLIAYYHDQTHLDWILRSGLYNCRLGGGRGSLGIRKKDIDVKYILLHTQGERTSNKLLKISTGDPKIYSRQELLEVGYPRNPSQAYYLVFEISSLIEEEFQNKLWNIFELEGHSTGHASALPFSVNLSALMKVAQ